MEPFYCGFLETFFRPILVAVEPAVALAVNTLHLQTKMDLLHLFSKILACKFV